MRLSKAAHQAHPWRIREIAPDFTLEDVWALPAHGDAGDFSTLVEVISSLDFPSSAPLPVRVLWSARDRLGRWFDLGRISAPIDATADEAPKRLPIPGTKETSLAARLPDDLRGTAPGGPNSPRRSCRATAPTSNTPQSCRTEPCTP